MSHMIKDDNTCMLDNGAPLVGSCTAGTQGDPGDTWLMVVQEWYSDIAGVVKNKGIRDAGSTADFRILFVILKFENFKKLENFGTFKN